MATLATTPDERLDVVLPGRSRPRVGFVPGTLCAVSLLADLASAKGGGVEWDLLALYTLAAGVVGGFLALLPDVVPATRPRRPSEILALVAPAAAVGLSVVDLSLRIPETTGGLLPPLLTAASLALLAFAGLRLSGER
jgi:hypothetical protein